MLTLCEEDNGYTHAEQLHLFMEKAVKDAGIALKDLSAVAVGLGPGSYTGLRIGMSAAKGLCYALQLPLIGISSLYNLSYKAKQTCGDKKDLHFIPLTDARRMEVYFSVFSNALAEIVPASAKVVDKNTAAEWSRYAPAAFFGSGMEKCEELLREIDGSVFIPGIKPSSENMAAKSYEKFLQKKFEDIAYCEPLYAKGFFETGKAQKE